jgi:hypothetical protein
VREPLSIDADNESPPIDEQGRNDHSREAWQRLIDFTLIEWGRDPGQLDDDGIVPPPMSAIQLAISLAKELSRRGLPAATRVVPDAHGGIVFEREGKDTLETIRISADGDAEYCVFRGSRLDHRESVSGGKPCTDVGH